MMKLKQMKCSRMRGEKGCEHFDPDDPPHRCANKQRGRGTYANDRLPVVGTVGRQSGQVRLRVVKDTKGESLVAHVHRFTLAGSQLYTDEYQIPEEAAQIALAANLQGYAFATSSYRSNGLAVLDAIEDLQLLVEDFRALYPALENVLLIGFSEGGAITALSVEQFPDIYAGGLAACGPIGSFRAQLDYPEDLANATTTISEALRYNVIGTNDAREKLGGSPFDNTSTVYAGSDDDAALNAAVPRYSADAAALTAIAAYETSGILTRPLVTLHTIYDAVVPFWHDPLYRVKVIQADNLAQHDRFVIARYGHCNFTVQEVQQAVTLLANRIANSPEYQPVQRAYVPLLRQGK